ncbi:IS4 family transposase [Dickeya fangzhongdai]
MHIAQALDLVSRYDSLRNPMTSLGDFLDPELISHCLAESGTVTLRKRRLPLEMMVWCIVGMALERKEPLHERLIAQTGDNTLTLFDKGYYSLGLLNAWHQAGEHRHWMLPLKKGAQYDVVRKLGKGDHLVTLKTSPQARKKWPELGDTMTARLLTVTRKGKVFYLLTSMTDAMRYPGVEMAELYSHRWEIELGYREIKQTMQIEREILRAPEQYLWLHRRFKTRPCGEASLYR